MYKIDKTTHSFENKFNKFIKKRKSKDLIKSLNEIESILSINPKDTTKRRNHPLKGEWKGFWSIRLDLENSYVLIFYVLEDIKTVVLYTVDVHKIYESEDFKIPSWKRNY